MLKLLLLFFTAFWGDVQVRTWGAINVSYGLGLPVSNRLNLVEFGLGYSHIGLGLSIAESYGFRANEQFIGSVLPLHLTVPLYQKIKFGRTEAYFDEEILLKLRGSPWGQRFKGTGNIDYLTENDWEAKAPYIGLEISARWIPARIAGLQATFGSLLVADAANHVYVNLAVTTGTSGPVSKHEIGPRLEIAGVVFDDAESGNSNGKLEPGEEGRLLVLLVNRGLQDSDSIALFAILRDAKLADYLNLKDVTIPSLQANHSIEASLPVIAGSRLPALPLRIRVWGKDARGNLVPPAYLEIPTATL
ncbi:hypothetical protein GF359_03620 [candidate division WOR-3 bacterium]|uniref:Uncharacterized protein n=1 Tax=candidate division WOR-3 bacterium TaxID=2052148 RepID=A0A9D5K8X0_UNCW3|nr:hypothetical protein [candidate division WOR-3 bacterium]MBD3364284.1 hypothetical protein [candidate division WOR-3 bacterium]